MKLHLLDEPMIQFCGGIHVDIRAGIAKFGVFDKTNSLVPNPIGVGLIGTSTTTAGVRAWLDRCRRGLKSEEKKLTQLRPSFPGMQDEVFGTRFEVSDRSIRTISRQDLDTALKAKGPLVRAVEVFMDHARDIASRTGVHVLIVAPPPEVFALGRSTGSQPDADLDEAQEEEVSYAWNFHDLFKARALGLAVPSQLVRPDTYGGSSTRHLGKQRVGSLQDEATRAWNFHTALYYKAGGVPWRLVRQSSALATCYVGASFYKSLDGKRVLTSVAQVFDERGEGLIVQGGNAHLDKDDRSPHLGANDARTLLSSGLASYRREHRTMPARVLLHKTSHFNQDEIAGFRQAANDHQIEVVDLVSVRRGSVRLFRAGAAPALRGTTLLYDDRAGIIYLKGTVPYFQTYPGAYVPRALEFSRDDGESEPLDLAKELLELSKLNFNNTQFDSGDPITVRAARRVGDILKHVTASAESSIQSRFRYFT